MAETQYRRQFYDDFEGADVAGGDWAVTITPGGGGGSAPTYTVSGGVLTLNSGTQTAAVISALCKRAMKLPLLADILACISQKIANVAVYVELIDTTDGTSYARLIWDGSSSTTPTTLQVACGNASGVQAPSSVSSMGSATTAAPGLHWILHFTNDEVWFHYGATNNASNVTDVKCLDFHLPDPTREYNVQLRIVTGGTAPASSTAFAIESIFVKEMDDAEIQIRNAGGFASAGKGLPVYIAGSGYTINATARAALFTGNVAIGALAANASIDGAPGSGGADLTTASYSLYGSLSLVAYIVTPSTGAQLQIQYSDDGATWRVAKLVDVSAGGVFSLQDNFRARWVKATFMNGTTLGTLQTTGGKLYWCFSTTGV